MSSEVDSWTITLNRYQRDNLIFLFALLGYADPDHKGLWPFTMIDNGDWAGEIPQKLMRPDGDHETYYYSGDDRANAVSIESVRDYLVGALAWRLHKTETGADPDHKWSGKYCADDGHRDVARRIVSDDY